MLQEKSTNRIVKFLITSALLYIAWLIIYYLGIKTYTNWDYNLNYSIVYFAEQLFQLFGTLSYIEIESDHVLFILDGGNRRPILIGDECNGFKLFSIFTIFLLSFPGNIKSKLWFIPMGLVIIHFANVIRVMALALINNYHPRFLDFNHLYTFTVFVYAIIFLLWYWWAKKYALNGKKD